MGNSEIDLFISWVHAAWRWEMRSFCFARPFSFPTMNYLGSAACTLTDLRKTRVESVKVENNDDEIDKVSNDPHSYRKGEKKRGGRRGNR